ncbi:transposase family protein [Streptomyces sp. NPDC051561]|uniref:transposase family protein n=1 Tax=Streptomyces sp. NPDC051561 TaxID=3365658 RepID=UPI0037AA3A6C
MTFPSRRPATELRCAVCLVKSPTRQHRAIGPLAERLRALADPRCRRGKRHPFVAVLLISCSVVVGSARSFVAIGEWAAEAPQDVLARLGAHTATALAVHVPPSGATIRRVVRDTCPGGLADLLGTAAGLNLIRLDSWWTDTPFPRNPHQLFFPDSASTWQPDHRIGQQSPSAGR